MRKVRSISELKRNFPVGSRILLKNICYDSHGTVRGRYWKGDRLVIKLDSGENVETGIHYCVAQGYYGYPDDEKATPSVETNQYVSGDTYSDWKGLPRLTTDDADSLKFGDLLVCLDSVVESQGTVTKFLGKSKLESQFINVDVNDNQGVGWYPWRFARLPIEGGRKSGDELKLIAGLKKTAEDNGYNLLSDKELSDLKQKHRKPTVVPHNAETRVKFFHVGVAGNHTIYTSGYGKEAFRLGGIYSIDPDESIECCRSGFHVCKNTKDSIHVWGNATDKVPVLVRVWGDKDEAPDKDAFRHMCLVGRMSPCELINHYNGCK